MSPSWKRMFEAKKLHRPQFTETLSDQNPFSRPFEVGVLGKSHNHHNLCYPFPCWPQKWSKNENLRLSGTFSFLPIFANEWRHHSPAKGEVPGYFLGEGGGDVTLWDSAHGGSHLHSYCLPQRPTTKIESRSSMPWAADWWIHILFKKTGTCLGGAHHFLEQSGGCKIGCEESLLYLEGT